MTEKMRTDNNSGAVGMIGKYALLMVVIGGLLFGMGFHYRWDTLHHSHEEPVDYKSFSPDSAEGEYVRFTIRDYLLAFEAGSTTQNQIRSGRLRVNSFHHSNHVYLLAEDSEGNDMVLDWPYGYQEMGMDRIYPAVGNPYTSRMRDFVFKTLPEAEDPGVLLFGRVKKADTEDQECMAIWGNHSGQEISEENIGSLIREIHGTNVVELYLEGDAPETVTIKDPDTYVWSKSGTVFMCMGGLFALTGAMKYLKGKVRRKQKYDGLENQAM